MNHPVVCGVDISEAARPVVDTAQWLAEGIGGRLVVVHAIEEPAAEADEFASIVRNRLSAGDHEVRLVEGSPVSTLLNAAEDERAEFLVVGSRGQSALGSALFGSVSREVITRARVPVVVVPPRISEANRVTGRASAGADARGNGGGHSIVCGVDGSEHALLAARVAGQLAQQLGCRLLVVHALHDLKTTASYLSARDTHPPLSGQSDAREKQAGRIVHDALDGLEADATGVVEEGSPWDVLESVADREGGWLLVVAARGRGAVSAALFGSVARRLATSASRPVVMVPDRLETP